MIEISLRKILISLAYIILASLPFYFVFRDYFLFSSNIFMFFLLIAFVCSAFLNTQEGLKKLNIFFILEVLIFSNIILLFLFLEYTDRGLILLLVTLTITKSIFFHLSENNFSHAANAIVVSSIIGSIGVILGVLEIYFSNTQILYQVMDFDYPYSNGKNSTILVNGFFASANGSAYCIGAGIAFVKYQNIFQNSLKNFIYFLLILSLVITKAKFGLLILTSFLIIFILKNSSKKILLITLLILCSSYIFLSHIIVAFAGSYEYPSVHFRKILFSIDEIDFILGNYGVYKLLSLEAINSNLFIPLGLQNFEALYGARPHFMIGSLIIYGGISLAVLVCAYIYFLLKDNIRNLFHHLNTNKIYICVLFAFIVETVNWNFGNNFYFWAIIFSTSSIIKRKAF